MSCDVLAVRTLIGDVDEVLISEESMGALITLYGSNPFTVAAAAARAIAAQYAGSVTKRAGDVSINASDKFKHYSDLAKQLESKAQIMALGGAGAFAGGISKADKDAREQNSDRVGPFFTRDLHSDESGGDE